MSKRNETDIDTLAPIVLFTYNRLSHLKQTVEALQKNVLAKESNLMVFSDGWADEENRRKVEGVREYLKTIQGFKSITLNFSETNNKLAPSLIAGITKILETNDRIIVFEDDIVCSELTLSFLNDALELYKDDEHVGMIHSHIEDIPNLPKLFFDSRGGCWAWATWKRAWSEIDFDGEYLLSQIISQKKEKAFDLNGSYRYTKMLRNQIACKNSSWAVRVYASFFLKDILILYPGNSYSKHIGYDTGTHCNYGVEGSAIDGRITATGNVAERIDVKIDMSAQKKIERFFRDQKKITLSRIKTEIYRRLKKNIQ